jgi:multidrug efflux system membrane fusion protein
MMVSVTGMQVGQALAESGKEQGVPLGVPVSGVVVEVRVAEGEQVKRGQRLLVLDPRPFRLRLEGLEATVRRLRPARDERLRELERAQDLYDRTVLSQVELQQAQNAADMAEAALQEAESARRLAELELEYSVLRAPRDGTVLRVHAGVGQVVVNRCEAVPLLWFEQAGKR